MDHLDPILEVLLADEADEATYKLLATAHDEDEGRVIEAARSAENVQRT